MLNVLKIANKDFSEKMIFVCVAIQHVKLVYRLLLNFAQVAII